MSGCICGLQRGRVCDLRLRRGGWALRWDGLVRGWEAGRAGTRFVRPAAGSPLTPRIITTRRFLM